MYWGAVRLYLPGFRPGCEEREHHLILGDWLKAPGGVLRHRAELLRRVAAHSLRSQPRWSFTEIRERAPREQPAAELPTREADAAEAHETPAAAPAAEAPPRAAEAEPRPARQSAESPVEEPPPVKPPAAESAPAEPAEPAAPKEFSPPAEPAPTAAAVAITDAGAGEPGEEPQPPAERPAGRFGWFRNRVRLLARLFSRAADPLVGEPVRRSLMRANAALAEQLAAAGRERDAAQRALQRSDEEKEFYLSECEKAEARAQEAESRERDGPERPLKRITQLAEQLKRLGHIPHPEGWKAMRKWCEDEFGPKVELRPGAVQGIKKAEFDDLWLAAECIVWLAGPYRDSRRISPGREADIKKDVDSRLSDGPAGKSVHFRDWEQVPRHERRNISRGNNRERKNCLRIYYYWDEAAEKVVIVSMPHHAQTRAS